jgi:hypothetical protein
MKRFGWIVLLVLALAGAAYAGATGQKVSYVAPGGSYWIQPYAVVGQPVAGTVFLANQNYLLMWYCNTQQQGQADGNFGRLQLSYPQRTISVSSDIWINTQEGANIWQPNTSSSSALLPPSGQLTATVHAYQPPTQTVSTYPVTVYTPGHPENYTTWCSCTVSDAAAGRSGYVADLHGWTCWCPC